jgi:hypothetical protein
MKMKIGKDVMMTAVGTVGGAVASKVASNFIKDKFPQIPAIIGDLAPVAIGVFLANNKKPLMKGIGYGMIAQGGADLAKNFIPGIGAPIPDVFINGDEDEEDEDNILRISAPADQSVLSEYTVNAPADQSVLSGYASEMEEMREMRGE